MAPSKPIAYSYHNLSPESSSSRIPRCLSQWQIFPRRCSASARQVSVYSSMQPGATVMTTSELAPEPRPGRGWNDKWNKDVRKSINISDDTVEGFVRKFVAGDAPPLNHTDDYDFSGWMVPKKEVKECLPILVS